MLRKINLLRVRPWLLYALVGILPACQLPLQPTATSVELGRAWQARQQQLSALQTWTLIGRIAIQANGARDARQEGWNGGLRWGQRDGDYDITISSPLGQEVAQLHGGAAGVTLRTSAGEDFALDGETLLQQRLGWRMPVSGLRFWVLGLADPNMPEVAEQDRVLDAQGRLVRLHQSGWEIEFRRYQKVGNVELPDKLFLSNQHADVQLELRLVVEQWETSDPAGPLPEG